MKQFLTMLLLAGTAGWLTAQTTTAMKVYNLFQSKCTACHSNAQKQGGLDLEGTGATAQAKLAAVYANIVNKVPSNATAAAAADRLIYPGRADRSFLFRKINQGLEPTIALKANEGAAMPGNGNTLSNTEKELIRQWILYGAKNGTDLVNEQLINDYYTKNGLPSFTSPPPAPAAGEGFQIKMGPFFLEPKSPTATLDEVEYFQKYELNMPADQEVNRIDVKISDYSHHFIIYNFTDNGSSVPAGLRLNANHTNIGLVAALQEATNLVLPNKTAFLWKKNMVLDLNSHYINYSSTGTYKAEAYINVYTQPVGRAKQQMYSSLYANLNINIPNNGNLITYEQPIASANKVYLWGLMGHTHKYGKGYKIFRRESNGQKGELLYDAACYNGVPGCVSPFFDYRHIPMRYFQPLLPVDMSKGIIHQASWINDGPSPVAFGPTSDDEMMVMIAMYTLDTTGLSTGIRETEGFAGTVRVYPNPMLQTTTFELPDGTGPVRFSLFDITGRMVRRLTDIATPTFSLDRDALQHGIYFYRIEDGEGRWQSGKLVIGGE